MFHIPYFQHYYSIFKVMMQSLLFRANIHLQDLFEKENSWHAKDRKVTLKGASQFSSLLNISGLWKMKMQNSLNEAVCYP